MTLTQEIGMAALLIAYWDGHKEDPELVRFHARQEGKRKADLFILGDDKEQRGKVAARVRKMRAMA